MGRPVMATNIAAAEKMVARGDGRRRRALVLFLVHFLLFCFFLLLQATEAHRSAIPSANHMSSLRRITKGIGAHGGGSHGGGRGRARVVPGGRGGAASTRNNGAASRSYSYSFPVVFVTIAAAVIFASF